MQKNRTIIILIAMILINFMIFFLQGYGTPIIIHRWGSASFVFLTVGLGLFLIRKYAPDLFNESKLILAEQRNMPLFGLYGVRRIFIAVWLMIVCGLVASKVDRLQEKITLRRYTENVIAPEAKAKMLTLSVGEKISLYGKETLATTFAAASEEFFSRLLILALLLAIMPPWAALLLSSFLFGLGHMPARLMGLEHWSFAAYKILPTAISGIFYGLCFMRFGVVWSIVAHTFWNMMTYLSPIYPQLNTFVLTVFAVILVFGLPIMLFELGLEKLGKHLIARNRKSHTNEEIQT